MPTGTNLRLSCIWHILVYISVTTRLDSTLFMTGRIFIGIFKVYKIYNSSYRILFCYLNLTEAPLFVSKSKAIPDLMGKYDVLLVYLYLSCVMHNVLGVK